MLQTTFVEIARIALKRHDNGFYLRDRRNDNAAAAGHRHLMEQYRLRNVRVADGHHVRRLAAGAELRIARSPLVRRRLRHVERNLARMSDTRSDASDKRPENPLLHISVLLDNLTGEVYTPP